MPADIYAAIPPCKQILKNLVPLGSAPYLTFLLSTLQTPSMIQLWITGFIKFDYRDRSHYIVPKGKTGLDLFRASAAEVQTVLLDVTLPGMSRGEVLDELRRIQPKGDYHIRIQQRLGAD